MTPNINRRPFGFRLVQMLMRLLLRLLTRVDVVGLENLPDHGPAILAPNHVAWFDVVPVFAYTKTAVVTFAAEKWEHHWALGPLMRYFGNAIFIQRGQVDREALEQALGALKKGAVMGVAPEGTRSYTGILGKGRDGAIWLASRTGAVIIPIAMWGHEDIEKQWKRLHRPLVHFHVGQPFHLPPEATKARSRDLPAYTDQLMAALASLLPPERRGVYGETTSTSGGEANG